MDLHEYIFKETGLTDPKQGMLLLAAPMLTDPYFRRSVILMLDRVNDGSHLGLVLNRTTDVTLDMLLDDWPGSENIKIHNGGPVELDRLFMLHCLADKIDDSVEIAEGIYSGGNADQIRDYIASGEETEGKIRFFLGYSGWESSQLTKEIVESTWAINPIPDSKTLLVGDGESYWRKEVERMGKRYKSWLNIPEHPSLN